MRMCLTGKLSSPTSHLLANDDGCLNVRLINWWQWWLIGVLSIWHKEGCKPSVAQNFFPWTIISYFSSLFPRFLVALCPNWITEVRHHSLNQFWISWNVCGYFPVSFPLRRSSQFIYMAPSLISSFSICWAMYRLGVNHCIGLQASIDTEQVLVFLVGAQGSGGDRHAHTDGYNQVKTALEEAKDLDSVGDAQGWWRTLDSGGQQKGFELSFSSLPPAVASTLWQRLRHQRTASALSPFLFSHSLFPSLS